VYEKAVRDDGSLLFPEKLTHEFLLGAHKTMGSYLYANQYQNEIIPDSEQTFKKDWIKYYHHVPVGCRTFIFIDPAISQDVGADYTAIVIVDADCNGTWFVRSALRKRMTPTQIIDLIFNLNAAHRPFGIGIESVAYQKALIYLLSEEMRKRQTVIPLKDVHPGTDRTKEMRIRTLVPRFEWGQILLAQGLVDLEMELSQFPRGSHDDLIDALSQIESIVSYPEKENQDDKEPTPANADAYEAWYRRNAHKFAREEAQDESPSW